MHTGYVAIDVGNSRHIGIVEYVTSCSGEAARMSGIGEPQFGCEVSKRWLLLLCSPLLCFNHDWPWVALKMREHGMN